MYFKTLPCFLNAYEPFLRAPEIQEMATLELALKVAFESPEMTSLSSKDLDTLGSAQRLHFHPSVQYLRFFQNTTSLWSALVCEQVPPRPHALDCVQHLIVWRQGNGARFRIVGAEEAHAFKNATTALAQPYLRSWVEAQLVLPPKRAGESVEK